MTIERVRAVIDAANGEGRQDDIMLALDTSLDLMPELLALWEAARASLRPGKGIDRASRAAEFRQRQDALRAALAALDAKAEEVLG